MRQIFFFTIFEIQAQHIDEEDGQSYPFDVPAGGSVNLCEPQVRPQWRRSNALPVRMLIGTYRINLIIDLIPPEARSFEVLVYVFVTMSGT